MSGGGTHATMLPAAFTNNFDGVVRIAACKSPRQSGIPHKHRPSGDVEKFPLPRFAANHDKTVDAKTAMYAI